MKVSPSAEETCPPRDKRKERTRCTGRCPPCGALFASVWDARACDLWHRWADRGLIRPGTWTHLEECRCDRCEAERPTETLDSDGRPIGRT